MNFYSLDGVKDYAKKRGRAVCAWIQCVDGVPIPGLGDTPYIIDEFTSAQNYRRIGLGVGKWTHRIVVNPDGKVEGL